MKKIVMPPGGQTTDISFISKWLVQKGDVVKLGDALLEVETDKAVLTVESFAAGTVLDILIPAGESAAEGEVLALIGDPTELENVQTELPSDKAASEDDDYVPIGKQIEPEQKKLMSIAVPEIKSSVCAMPNAKKAALEYGVRLSEVAKVVDAPFITRNDVEAYVNSHKSGRRESGDYSIIPVSRMRQIIAARLHSSVQTCPTFTATVEIDMTACNVLRCNARKKYSDIKIGWNDILMKATAKACKQFPLINAAYTDKEIKIFSKVNVGLAVSVEEGLVVPVCRDADSKSISEISKENTNLIQKAREKNLLPEDMAGGTITISNLGMYPISHFTAILNPPEACILSIGSILERNVKIDNMWKDIPTMTITATFDHRLIDGAYGAAFLGELKSLLENPAMVLI